MVCAVAVFAFADAAAGRRRVEAVDAGSAARRDLRWPAVFGGTAIGDVVLHVANVVLHRRPDLFYGTQAVDRAVASSTTG